MIDVASQQINHRILQCPGLVRYQELEAVLVSGQVIQVVRKYPELASDSEDSEDHFRLNVTCFSLFQL